MTEHRSHVSGGLNIVVGFLMTLIPPGTLDVSEKLLVAFGCGFCTLAGQALWGYILKRLLRKDKDK
jgi:hypothetical protein